jgi:hypothetical protein
MFEDSYLDASYEDRYEMPDYDAFELNQLDRDRECGEFEDGDDEGPEWPETDAFDDWRDEADLDEYYGDGF